MSVATLCRITQDNSHLSKGDFQTFVKHLFDDSEELDSSYAKHSECFVTRLADVDLEWAEVLKKRFNLPWEVSELVGHWKIEGTSDYSWGFQLGLHY